MEAENTLESPDLIKPKKSDFSLEKDLISDTLSPMSFIIYKLTAI